MSEQRYKQGDAVEYLKKKGVPVHQGLMSGLGKLHLGPSFERNGRNKEFTQDELDQFAEDYHRRASEDAA